MGKFNYKKNKNKELDDTGVYAASLDPMVFDYLAKFARLRWTKEELDKKVNKEAYELQIESIKNETKSLKDLVSEHKGKISKAPKRHEITELKSTLTGWSGWFRKSVFGFIFFLVGVGSTAIWEYSVLNSKVENVDENIKKMSKSINELKDTQENLQEKIRFYKSALRYNMKKQDKGAGI